MKLKNKILITLSLIGFSTYSFADMKECLLYAAQDDNEKTIEYCTPYLKDKNNPEATGILGAVATEQKNYKKSLDYKLWLYNYYKGKENLNSNEKEIYTGTLTAIGSIYYFGEAGKTDKTKGLEYITKAADSGNTIAQKQLGGFYGSDGTIPSQNASQAYKWFKAADINRNEETGSNSYIQTLNSYFSDKPYCIAMGEQLVAQAYLDGSAGLSVNKSKAKEYLSQAIAIYKDNEPTKASYEYCAKQKGLDLDGAEKLYKSL